MKLPSFASYAWFALLYNVVVIAWGVFLRASKSGDGCGQYWLTCHGEVIPSAPEFKTVIEFSHRVMSGIDLLVVIVLVIWAFRRYSKGNQIRKFAVVSLLFIITEALIGAGLVLTGNTADAITDTRPFWAIGHLINTFILLAALSLTAWTASGGSQIDVSRNKKALALMITAAFGILLIGSSGALAALSSTLFPVDTLAEGIRQDFSSASHLMLRLRISHPILSIIVSVFLVFLAGWLKSQRDENKLLNKLSTALTVLVIVQLVFGALTLITLAPIVMQLIHLLLADAVWIVFVLICAAFLGREAAETT